MTARGPVARALDRLDDVAVPDQWDEIAARAARPVGIGTVAPPPRRSRRPAWALAAVAVTAAVAVVVALLVRDDHDHRQVTTSSPSTTAASTTTTSSTVPSTDATATTSVTPPTTADLGPPLTSQGLSFPVGDPRSFSGLSNAAFGGRFWFVDTFQDGLFVVDGAASPIAAEHLDVPGAFAVAASEGGVWVVTSDKRVERVADDGTVTPLALLEALDTAVDLQPRWLIAATRDQAWVTSLDTDGRIYGVGASGAVRTVDVGHPVALLARSGERVWAVGEDRVTLIDAASATVAGTVTSVDPTPGSAQSRPVDVASNSTALYVSRRLPATTPGPVDAGPVEIIRIDAATLATTTLATLTPEASDLSPVHSIAASDDAVWIASATPDLQIRVRALDPVTGAPLGSGTQPIPNLSDGGRLAADVGGVWLLDDGDDTITRYPLVR